MGMLKMSTANPEATDLNDQDIYACQICSEVAQESAQGQCTEATLLLV